MKKALLGLLFLAGTASGQSDFASCDATPALSAQLEKAVTRASDPELPFDARMAGFRDLMRRYPSDLFLHRLYLAHFSGYHLLPLFDRLLPEYEALYLQNSADPARRYLHALSRVKRDPRGSTIELEKLSLENPTSPWPRLTLAYIYGHIKPTEDTKAALLLKEFAGLCPNTLDQEALQRFASDGSVELKSVTVERLQRQLSGRTDRLAMEAWPLLWQLEFQITPASGHDKVRDHIRSDLTMLRALRSETEDYRLRVLRRGYILINDGEGRAWSQAELMRVAPKSAIAAEATIEDWETQHPSPGRSTSFADRIAFQRKEWDVARKWTERWPNYGHAWDPLYTAFFIEDLSSAEIAALGRKIVPFVERNRDYTFGLTDPPTLLLAERFASTATQLAAIPALLNRALLEEKERRNSDMAAATGPFGADQIAMNFRTETSVAAGVRSVLLSRTGKPDAAQVEIRTILREIDRAPTNSPEYWRGIVAAADAAITGNFTRIAGDSLARMDSALADMGNHFNTQVQKRQHAMHEADYWETRAKLALAESRHLDGVAYFLRAVSATPRDFDPTRRSRLAFLAHKEWTSAGGTEDGWQAYNPDVMSGASPSQWVAVERKMQDFRLQDSSGQPVRLSDLSGRKVFINVWATWCGPCQGELPWVERLYQELKARKDIAVLTFNVDENPGLIKSYMREHNLTFPVILAADYVNSTMKVETIPRNWLIDEQGVLRFERQAGFDGTFVKDTIAAIGRLDAH